MQAEYIVSWEKWILLQEDIQNAGRIYCFMGKLDTASGGHPECRQNILFHGKSGYCFRRTYFSVKKINIFDCRWNECFTG